MGRLPKNGKCMESRVSVGDLLMARGFCENDTSEITMLVEFKQT
jgi:hypothetical protein